LGGASVALGFATLENIFYLERYGTMTLLVRSVITIPAHAFFTIPMGVLMAYAKRAEGAGFKYLWLLAGLTVSTVFHGLYDIWLSLDSEWLGYLAYLQVILMGWLALWLSKIPPFDFKSPDPMIMRSVGDGSDAAAVKPPKSGGPRRTGV